MIRFRQGSSDTPLIPKVPTANRRSSGLDRCLWGTDWTRAFAVVNYEQGVEPFLKTNRLSDGDRATLMSGSCAKAYRWSPKKA